MPLDPLLVQLVKHCGLEPCLERSMLLELVLRAFSRIPYENITKIIRSSENPNTLPKESPEEIIRGFIESGSGGTCFPLTRTLVYLLSTLGFEAHPILADRRYGADTHCAVLFRDGQAPWQLLDPGYLIYTPCEISSQPIQRHELSLSPIELRLSTCGTRAELFTLAISPDGALQSRYRLTYKLLPVDPDEFERAWDRSFSWDMMRYPVVSLLVGGTQIYLQKDTLLTRSRAVSERKRLLPQEIVVELSRRLPIDPTLVRKALGHLDLP